MGASGSKENPYLYVVEDCDDDLFLLTRALRKNGITHPIESAADGAQGINYFKALLAEGPDPTGLPSLVLLDLKMPRLGGKEVLSWIRSQPPLHHLPVYVLSSSELDSDGSAVRASGASDYWK